MGEIDLSCNSVICSLQYHVNLYLHQHIHICLVHEERYDVYYVPFLAIIREINWLIAEAC